jgi:hypothetical protein
MAIAPGRRSDGAGASARRVGELARAAERIQQHRRAKVMLPLTAAGAAVVGVAAGTLLGWQAGTVAALAVLAYGTHRIYRRARNSWTTGAVGEEATARLLRPLARRGYVVLHDRAIPGSRANIDHLVAGPFGVALIDSKNWQSKKSALTITGGLLRYGRYDQTKALQTVVWEAEQAARALGVPVRPVLAVHGAKVPAPRGRTELHGVTVVEAKKLRGMLYGLPAQPGWDASRVTAIEEQAERRLPRHSG